jgi:hypothetical protein
MPGASLGPFVLVSVIHEKPCAMCLRQLVTMEAIRSNNDGCCSTPTRATTDSSPGVGDRFEVVCGPLNLGEAIHQFRLWVTALLALSERNHGSWYFDCAVPVLSDRRERLQRGGYPTDAAGSGHAGDGLLGDGETTGPGADPACGRAATRYGVNRAAARANCDVAGSVVVVVARYR